jgi:ABC-type transport system involved in resistance to organic solvents, ATPase component
MNCLVPHITVKDLTMAYGDFVLQRDMNFVVNRGDIFIIMGGSGCGKTTLLRNLVGLKEPARGQVFYGEVSFWESDQEEQGRIMRQFGILYQSGALWTSMTLSENIALPLREYTDLNEAAIREIASLKLSLVGLKGFEDFYPSEISGGMRKRAGLARAMALDPEILFFDELSAGLDPISARLLGRSGSGNPGEPRCTPRPWLPTNCHPFLPSAITPFISTQRLRP